ncbi:MAG: hypothetical protein GF417_11270, partial [Candidatus Latescibacteria bacterium]|nr:hypothetical protein [Candidatus Latescibacterota bacterium]
MKRPVYLIILLMITCSCSSLTGSGGKGRVPDHTAAVDMITRLEHHFFREEYRVVSETGREYLRKLSGTEEEGKARILIAKS